MQDYVTNYEEAVEYLCRIPRFHSTHSLERIADFLTRMGQPDRQMEIVHIAGTNGKGSTSAYLAGLLEQAGKKVGLFTSPHLTDIRERFCINGKMISKELLTEATVFIQKQLQSAENEYQPCFFDMMFFIGMYVFAKEQVDILVLETGLGGRLDATNAVQQKALTLITHIGLDHTEYLGSTIEEIAAEKAGIMRTKTPCIVGMHNEAVARIFLKKAAELDSPCRILDKAVCCCQRLYEKSVAFSYFSSYYGTVPIQLSTSAWYQAENVCLALAGMENLVEQGILAAEALSADKIKKALFDTNWAGRMEEILPGVFLDGAHNTDGIAAFLESAERDGCKGSRRLIFSAVSDKEYGKMLQMILQSGLFTEVIVTEISGERKVEAEKLFEVAKAAANRDTPIGKKDLQEAVSSALEARQQQDYIYIVGSLYLVGQVRKQFRNPLRFLKEQEGETV